MFEMEKATPASYYSGRLRISQEGQLLALHALMVLLSVWLSYELLLFYFVFGAYNQAAGKDRSVANKINFIGGR